MCINSFEQGSSFTVSLNYFILRVIIRESMAIMLCSFNIWREIAYNTSWVNVPVSGAVFVLDQESNDILAGLSGGTSHRLWMEAYVSRF